MNVVRVRPFTRHPWTTYTHYAHESMHVTLCGRVRPGVPVSEQDPSPPPLCPRCEARLLRLTS